MAHDVVQAAGVKVDKGDAIVVDEYSKTSVDNIYAIGDVTNRLALTPVAIMEAMAFTATVFGGKPTKPIYEKVATLANLAAHRCPNVLQTLHASHSRLCI